MPLASTTHLNLRELCREGQLNEALHILLTTYNPPEGHSTYLDLLQACILKNAPSQGRKVQSFVAHRQFAFSTNTVFHNKLIFMYVKCGSLVDARKVFEHIKEPDRFSWNTIIAAYRRYGCPQQAVTLFHRMQKTGLQPDRFTFSSVFAACAKMGALEPGMDIHKSIKDRRLLSDVVVATALLAGVKPDLTTFASVVHACSKMGTLEQGIEIHRSMKERRILLDMRDVVSWTAMVAGYAQNGSVEKALETFKQMQLAGVKPNYTTFTCVLSACSHAGLVVEGCTYFNHMSNSYCITPTVDQYVCMVDILARAGYLEDTLNFIIKMPTKPVVVVWMSFLGACRSHKNIGLGVFTAELLFDMDPKNDATYILLSNIYAEVGMWVEVQMITSTDTGDLCIVREIGLGDEGGRLISRFKAFT
ncbi:pentatricopeptide repeat-containing protein At5g40410, mitochondrial [Cryptomeria japonica]|uniref:pentatricopeptide repeat-containing protein At5g40410, mitochondrial n=1 Tax=Cryptomeria japonica TaxID=3369 RepID=UPI0025AD462B|nr:pentatricopeptide repeat-containing protein At5g40410, mitochondrial [Cryptomeria japonica]